MTGEWKYGTIVRRAITKNPYQYVYYMFVGPNRRHPAELFVGVCLTELPPPATGSWIAPPKPRTFRTQMRRALFEIAPEFAE